MGGRCAGDVARDDGLATVRAQRIKLPVGLPELEATVKADSNDAVAHYNVALGYWSRTRYDDAERELVEATTLDPRFAMAYLARAYLPFARRPELWNEVLEGRVPTEWTAALETSTRLYRQAFMIDPLVDMRIAGAVVPPKSILWETDEALAAIYQGWARGFDDFRDADYAAVFFRLSRMVDALLIGRHSLSKIPSGILWYRGLAAAHLDRHADAIRDSQELLDRSVGVERRDSLVYVPLRTNEYRYVLAVLKQRAGDDAGATQLFREALENDRGLYMAHVQLARLAEKAGDLDGAL